MVAQKLGIPLPKASYSTPGEAKEARLRGQLLDAHERAVAFFQECLRRPEGARAREYLAGRGLDQEMIARFRIGYAPDSGFLLRDRLKEEFSEEVLRESGLFSWKEAASSEPRAVSKQFQSGDDDPQRSAEILRALRMTRAGAVRTSKLGARSWLPCIPSSGTASCSPSPAKRGKSSRLPAALLLPMKNPAPSI
jgi:hypothetical protein